MRVIRLGITGVVALLTLAGCQWLGTAGSQTAKIPLKVLYYADQSAAGWPSEQARWKSFQDANPDIDLQLVTRTGTDFHNTLTADINAADLPDVFTLWPSARLSSAPIYANGLAKSLADVLPLDLLAAFPAALRDPSNFPSGKFYELPQAVTYTSVLYVHKTLLSTYGTYADLKSAVGNLNGAVPVTLPDGDLWPAQSCLLSTMVGRYLGNAFIDGVKTGTRKFTDADFEGVLDAYRQLYTDGIIDAGDAALGYGDGPGRLTGGTAAALIDGDWRVPAYNPGSGATAISTADQQTAYDLAPLPAFPNEVYPGVQAAIQGIGLAMAGGLEGDKLNAAIRLFRWYYSNAVQTSHWEAGDYVPTRTDVTSSNVTPLMTKLKTLEVGWAANTCYVLDGVLDPTVFNALNQGLHDLATGVQTSAQVAATMQAAQDKLLSGS